MASYSLTKLKDKLARMQVSTKRAREKAGELTEAVVNAAEISGTAFAVGYFEGKIDKPEDFEVFGVPIPMAAGLGAHALAIFGIGRGMEDHLRAFGNGFLASHLNGVGRRLGTTAKLKSGGAPATAGELPGRRQGMGITEEQLAAAARAA